MFGCRGTTEDGSVNQVYRKKLVLACRVDSSDDSTLLSQVSTWSYVYVC